MWSAVQCSAVQCSVQCSVSNTFFSAVHVVLMCVDWGGRFVCGCPCLESHNSHIPSPFTLCGCLEFGSVCGCGCAGVGSQNLQSSDSTSTLSLPLPGTAPLGETRGRHGRPTGTLLAHYKGTLVIHYTGTLLTHSKGTLLVHYTGTLLTHFKDTRLYTLQALSPLLHGPIEVGTAPLHNATWSAVSFMGVLEWSVLSKQGA